MLTSLLSFLGFDRLTWKGIPLKSSSSFELREIAKADDDFARKLLSNIEACDALKETDLFSLADTYEFFARGIFEMPNLSEKLTPTSLRRLGLKYEFVAQEIVNSTLLSKKLTGDDLLHFGLKYVYWANYLLQNPNIYKKLENKHVLELSIKYIFFARKVIRNPELSEKLSPEDLENLRKKGPFPPQKNLFKTDFDPKWDHKAVLVSLPTFITLSFHWALQNNECDTERIQYLLAQEVDIDEPDENNLTPLQVVLNTDNFALAIQFIQQGASSIVVDSNGNTPLHIAVAKEQIAIVELMLKTIVNIDIENKSKSTPLAIAAAAKDHAMAEMLLKHGASPAMKDTQGNIPLHIAISQKHETLALLYIKHRSPINAYNYLGHSPFIMALQSNLFNVAIELMRQGANIRAPANDGKTPLYFAIRYCPDIVKEFIPRVNLNTLVDVCTSALQLAIQLGNKALAFQLLAAEAKPYAINTSFCPSPLWLAIQLGAPDLVQALIAAGADINEVYNLESLLRIAITLHKYKEATLLMKAPGFDKNLHSLCLTENLFVEAIDDEFYSLLIAKGADIDFQNPEGNTPLHVAIAKGYKAKATLLIEKGANLTLRNRENETALHIAIRQKTLLFVRLLVSKGAQVKAKPDASANMLQFAVRVSLPPIVNYLLKTADFVNNMLEDECLLLRECLPNKAMHCVLFSYLPENAIPKETLDKYPQLTKAYRNYQRGVFIEMQRTKFFAYGARKLHLPLELVAFIYSKQIDDLEYEIPITESIPENMPLLYHAKIVKSLREGFFSELLMTEERKRQLKLN